VRIFPRVGSDLRISDLFFRGEKLPSPFYMKKSGVSMSPIEFLKLFFVENSFGGGVYGSPFWILSVELLNLGEEFYL
jgi:hypothetical protein